MVHVDQNSEKHSAASSTRKRSRKVWTASINSKTCRLASGNIRNTTRVSLRMMRPSTRSWLRKRRSYKRRSLRGGPRLKHISKVAVNQRVIKLASRPRGQQHLHRSHLNLRKILNVKPKQQAIHQMSIPSKRSQNMVHHHRHCDSPG